MDEYTLNKLEFDTVRQQVADLARSSMGKEACRQMSALRDEEILREQIARTDEMIELLDARMEPPLGGLKDVRLLSNGRS